MARYIWCRERMKFVAPHEVIRREVQRSHLSSPNIRPDGMSQTWNPADGKHYDSKSGYYDAVRKAGCEIVGNEKMPEQKAHEPTNVKQDISDAIDQLNANP